MARRIVTPGSLFSLVLVSLALGALVASTFAVGQSDRVTRRGIVDSKGAAPSSRGFGVGPRMTEEQEAFATSTAPVSEEVIKAFVPESVAGLERASLDGSTRYFGAAGTSKVTATYIDEEGAELTLEIVDPCGIPTADVPYYLQMLPEGRRRDDAKATLEGHKVSDYPATLKTEKTGAGRKMLQLFLYPRMRVTLLSEQVGVEAMISAASALELDSLAQLAPEVPPGVTEPRR